MSLVRLLLYHCNRNLLPSLFLPRERSDTRSDTRQQFPTDDHHNTYPKRVVNEVG